MIILFYENSDGKIEPLGAGDFDFNDFFFSPDLRKLIHEELKLTNRREEARKSVENFGCYITWAAHDEKRFYVLNTEHDLNSKYFHKDDFSTIKKALRDFKIEQIIE